MSHWKGFNAREDGESESENPNFRMAVAIVGHLVGNGYQALDFKNPSWMEDFQALVREIKMVLDAVQ